MRCYYHPKEEAVAICMSCGKGICQQCTVLVEGNSHCRTCVETRGITSQIAQTAIPKSAGIPSKIPFVIGGVGAIMSGVAAVLSIFGGIGSLWIYGFYYNYYWTAVFSMICSVLLAVGLVLAGIGYKGIRTNYGSIFGTVGFALGFVSCVFLLIDAVIVIMARLYHSYSYYDAYFYYYPYPWYTVFVILAIIALELFAVTQIFWGVAHIYSRKYTGNVGLAVAAGIMLIISGGFTASLQLAFVGMIMFLVGMILAMMVFLTSMIPRSGSTKNTRLAPPP
jgi:hypothetical protein